MIPAKPSEVVETRQTTDVADAQLVVAQPNGDAAADAVRSRLAPKLRPDTVVEPPEDATALAGAKADTTGAGECKCLQHCLEHKTGFLPSQH